MAAEVHRDDAHLLRHREHRHFDLAGDALGGAVPGAGLGGGDVGVGNEVNVGAGDTRPVGGEDDRAVHLGQLGEPLRREFGVEQKPAGADVEHLGLVADDDQRAHLRLQDAVDAFAQRRAGRDQPQRSVEGFRSGLGHGPLQVGCSTEGTQECVRYSPRRLPENAVTGRERQRGRRGRRPDTSSIPGDIGGGRGHDRAREAEALRFREPATDLRNLAHLAAEAELAHHHRVGRDPGVRRGRRRSPALPRGRPPAPPPALRPQHSRKYPDRPAKHPRALLHDRNEHREPATVERLRRRAAGIGRRRLATSACTSTHSGRVPSSTAATTDPDAPDPAIGEEQRARVGDRNEALARHLHETELVGGPEPVLQGAQHAQRVMAITLEREHGVDDVLERARPGEGAVLGDVPDRAASRCRGPWRDAACAAHRRAPG